MEMHAQDLLKTKYMTPIIWTCKTQMDSLVRTNSAQAHSGKQLLHTYNLKAVQYHNHLDLLLYPTARVR